MGPTVTAEQVADFLRAHPHFLAESPELYRMLAPPARVHGEVGKLTDGFPLYASSSKARR